MQESFSRQAVVAALVGGALVLAACGKETGKVAPEAGAPQLTITPADGTDKTRPDQPVTVTATGGTLQEVTVQGKGRSVPGDLSSDGTTWKARWTLIPGVSYQVSATAKSRGGKTTTATSRFQTAKAGQSIAVSEVSPTAGETVGAGMPIVVSFNRAVGSRAAVERALEVQSNQSVEGAWRWVSDQQVIFRPRQYWQPHQQISLVAHLAGVRAAKGVYGTADYTRTFKIGQSHISTVNTKTHRMVVKVDGKTVKNTPMSAGRGGARMFTTTNGVHLVMGKGSPVTMTSGWMGVSDEKDPNFYKLTVYYAVQISGSGEYVHSAPWSLGSQGKANVSHGCINTPPTFAKWFYGISRRGDVVTVTGTSRQLEWNNGFGYWQTPWKQWLKASALKQPVMTTAVQPAATPAPAAPSPVPS